MTGRNSTCLTTASRFLTRKTESPRIRPVKSLNVAVLNELGQGIQEAENTKSSGRGCGQQLDPLPFPRIRRQRLDVAQHFDHRGATTRNRAIQCGAQLGRFRNANAERSH